MTSRVGQNNKTGSRTYSHATADFGLICICPGLGPLCPWPPVCCSRPTVSMHHYLTHFCYQFTSVPDDISALRKARVTRSISLSPNTGECSKHTQSLSPNTTLVNHDRHLCLNLYLCVIKVQSVSQSVSLSLSLSRLLSTLPHGHTRCTVRTVD